MQNTKGDDILRAIESITDEQLLDINLKERLQYAARRLLYRTESAHNLTDRIYFSSVPQSVAKLGVDLGVFRLLASEPSKRWTAEEIAQQVRCDPRLLVRILRGMVAYGLAAQSDDNTYSSNEATKLFSNRLIENGLDHNRNSVSPTMHALPDFLKASGYVQPVDASNTAFNMALNTTLGPFEWLAQDESRLVATTGFMQIQRIGQKSWIDEESFFPAAYFAMNDEDVQNGRVVFVDVGGGAGHVVTHIRKARKEIKGRMVLQDRAEVLSKTDPAAMESLKIECVPHDFEAPQAIRDARIYYVRNVLHDWPDSTCHTILFHLKEAMKSDSRVIIDEIAVKEVGSNLKQVNYDFAMMGVMAAQERTKMEWQKMLELVDLTIEKVIEYDSQTGDSLIIAAPVK